MAEYKGSIEFISGITPKNGLDFPLVNAKDVLMPDGTRLSEFTGGGSGGANGISITKAEINSDGELVFTYSNGNTDNVGRVVGTGLPAVSEKDNGKVLKVIDGAWAADTVEVWDGTDITVTIV